MKRLSITIFLCLIGMALFAQGLDMSYYTEEYMRPTGTYLDRLEVLQNVRDAELTGIGEFYHEALKYLILKIPDIKTKEDKDHSEAAAKILCQGLSDEKFAAAAPDLWEIVQFGDTVRDNNDGLVMQEAIYALGQVGDTAFAPFIALRLDNFNTDVTSDVETKRRVQRGVAGCINALEALHDIEGYSSVFFAYAGWYDPVIKNMAYAALPNIVEDPADVVIKIIQDTNNNPTVKYEAWKEMLRTRAPDSSKAKVAATALAMGWGYPTSSIPFQRSSREMRMSAIDTIRLMGVADDSVYGNLEKSYSNNFVNPNPEYEEIRKTIDALSVIKTEEAVELLLKFLRELHGRRRDGPWGNRERQVMQLVIPAIGATGTNSMDVRTILTTIQRSQDYTSAEQAWAAAALKALGF